VLDCRQGQEDDIFLMMQEGRFSVPDAFSSPRGALADPGTEASL